MAARLDPQETEKPTRASNDSEVPIKSEKQNDEPAEKKKGTNGFLVSPAVELTAASSSVSCG